MTRVLRAALAVTALAGAASFATPASATRCGEPIVFVCETVGYVCRTVEEDTFLGVRCAPIH